MRFAKAVTTKTLTPITIAGSNFTVIAREEQIPRTCTVTGLDSFKGSFRILIFFLENRASLGSVLVAWLIIQKSKNQDLPQPELLMQGCALVNSSCRAEGSR